MLRQSLIVPLSRKWTEGAVVKDTDTQIVYVANKGRLVQDPRFVRPAAFWVTIRRGVFVLCVVGIAVWAIVRVRRSAKQTAGPVSP